MVVPNKHQKTGMQKGAQISEVLQSEAEGIEVTFYTDPLCCWTWAMGPAWRRLMDEYGAKMNVHFKMGGLLPSWKHFADGVHSISRPAQMGPEWMHAAHLSGVVINSRIWIEDPPASSYPACIAVKCVQLQSEAYVEDFFYLLQQSVMERGKNIAKLGTLFDATWQLQDRYHEFDLSQFKDDLLGSTGKQAFKKDLQEAKYLQISRFPTLVIRTGGGSAVMLTGYQTYEALRDGMGLAMEG